MVVQCFKDSVCASFHQLLLSEGRAFGIGESICKTKEDPRTIISLPSLPLFTTVKLPGKTTQPKPNQQFYLMCPSQILLRVARRQRWWWSWFSRNLREEAQPWHSEDYRSNHHWDPASIYLEKTKSAPRNTEIIFWNTTPAPGNILK